MRTTFWIKSLVFTLFIMTFWSCAAPEFPPLLTGPDTTVYNKAEIHFRQNNLDKALATYIQFLNQYPQSPHADGALLKIGTIHSLRGDQAAARDYFTRILRQFPESALIKDAEIKILSTYYFESRFDKVITDGRALLTRLSEPAHRALIYILLGDTFKAMALNDEALQNFYLALTAAEGLDTALIRRKIRQTLESMTAQELEFLLSDTAYETIYPDILFQIGITSYQQGRQTQSLYYLNQMIDRYPRHENVRHAQLLIAEIQQMAVVTTQTVSCLLPLSGRFQAHGQRALNSIELALIMFQKKHDNPSVRITVHDTASSENGTIQAATEVLKQNAAAVIGPIAFPEAAIPILQENGIPTITLSHKPGIPQTGNFIFRNFLTPEMQVSALISYLSGTLGLHHFALLYPDEPYGRSFMNLFWDEALKHNCRIVGAESYKTDMTDFSTPIKKLSGLHYPIPKDLKPEQSPDIPETPKKEEPAAIVDFDAVFIPDNAQTASLIIPQLLYHDIDTVYFLGTNAWHSPLLIERAGPYAEKVIIPDGFFVDSDNPATRQFVEQYRAFYNESPGLIEANAFDSAMILFELINRHDIRTRIGIADALSTLTGFKGATGDISFDPDGEVVKAPRLITVRRNAFYEITDR